MRYMEIGNSGVRASVVAIGTFGIGGGNTWSDTKTDEGMTSSILDAALDCGVNLVDTAPVYGIGTSETFLKKALKGRREKFFIQTKCGLNWREGDDSMLEYIRDEKYVRRNLRAEAIRKDLEDSLFRMGIDHVDIYITHRQSNITPVEETMGELLKMKKEGKIRAIGISNASPEILGAYEKVGHVDQSKECGILHDVVSCISQFISAFIFCYRYQLLFIDSNSIMIYNVVYRTVRWKTYI